MVAAPAGRSPWVAESLAPRAKIMPADRAFHSVMDSRGVFDMNKQELAAELLDALDRGRTIPSVAKRSPGFGWDEGYEVAAEIVTLRRARGEKPVGRKIGFTNRNIWPEYGATAPIWAHVYDDTLIYARNNAATISLEGSVQPKIEPEIAFKLRAP